MQWALWACRESPQCGGPCAMGWIGREVNPVPSVLQTPSKAGLTPRMPQWQDEDVTPDRGPAVSAAWGWWLGWRAWGQDTQVVLVTKTSFWTCWQSNAPLSTWVSLLSGTGNEPAADCVCLQAAVAGSCLLAAPNPSDVREEVYCGMNRGFRISFFAAAQGKICSSVIFKISVKF